MPRNLLWYTYGALRDVTGLAAVTFGGGVSDGSMPLRETTAFPS